MVAFTESPKDKRLSLPGIQPGTYSTRPRPLLPDDTWTWDDLVNASQTIYDKTGKYGYMAYADEQLGYWNFVYQAGGYILNEG